MSTSVNTLLFASIEIKKDSSRNPLVGESRGGFLSVTLVHGGSGKRVLTPRGQGC